MTCLRTTTIATPRRRALPPRRDDRGEAEASRPLNDDHMSYGWGAASPNCTTPQCAPCDLGEKCLILDDQFALVPRLHAERYFWRNVSSPSAPDDESASSSSSSDDALAAASAASAATTTLDALVARRWLHPRMLGWARCCRPLPPSHHGPTDGWHEAQFTRALLMLGGGGAARRPRCAVSCRST